VKLQVDILAIKMNLMAFVVEPSNTASFFSDYLQTKDAANHGGSTYKYSLKFCYDSTLLLPKFWVRVMDKKFA
jgi:hypothetical protein